MSFAHLKRGAFSNVVKHYAKAPTFLFLLPAIFDYCAKKGFGDESKLEDRCINRG